MKNLVILFVCFALTNAQTDQSTTSDINPYEEEQKILSVLLSSEDDGYNPNRPPGNPVVSPVEVKSTIYVLDIHSVNDLTNEFTMQFYFRQQWRDSRLDFDHFDTQLQSLQVKDEDSIWKPDTFFVHENEGKLHAVTMPNIFIRIDRKGNIKYSVRLSMTFRCKMDLRSYPMDSQLCAFTIESYGSQADKITYMWNDTSSAVMINPDIDMPDFVVSDHKFSTGEVKFTSGRYSFLKMELLFKRKLGYFMNRLYVPFIILVITSWLSFWIRPKFNSLRLTLILTILFIMLWLGSDINRNTPRVSYTKAVDVWTGVCLSLVFTTLLQFILVSHLARSKKHKNPREVPSAVDAEILIVRDGNDEKHSLETASSMDSVDVRGVSQIIAFNLNGGRDFHDRIDVFSRVIFPVLFGVFNVIYWLVYWGGN